MTKIMSKFADHHIHTSYSRCAPGNYDLSKIIEKLDEKGFPYYCVSDHIHYDYDDAYFSNHLQMKDKFLRNGLKKPIYLGAEFTILDEQGTLPKQTQGQSLNQLDYSIVADHYIPHINITMNDLVSSRNLLLNYMVNSPEKIDHLFEIIKNAYINCIEKYKPTILGHPFSTFLRCGFPHKKLIELLLEICDTCKENNTAVEINNSDAERCMNIELNSKKTYSNLLSMKTFYIEFLSILKKSNVLISFGSDAHRPNSIGDFVISLDLFYKFELNPLNVIRLN